MNFPRLVLLCFALFSIGIVAVFAQVNASSKPLHVNGLVYALASQPDGKLIVGGEFTQINGKPRNNLARLNADGSVDDSFVGEAGEGIMGIVRAVAVGGDGSIVVGGSFNRANNEMKMNLARYLANGKLDEKFPLAGGPNGQVFAVQVLADGKVAAGGQFSAILSGLATNLVLYNPDGSLASSQAALQGNVYALSVFSAGGFSAGGNFQIPGSQTQALATFK